MNKNDLKIEQLLNNKFVVESGYSYSELLTFLKAFQSYYIDCCMINENYKKELLMLNKNNLELGKNMITLEQKNKNVEKENIILTSKISRKLSIWERISGRIKY